MSSIAWWTNVAVLVVASGIDVRTRRIPNWLVLPFLCSGLLVQSIGGGFTGLRQSLGGIALAALLYGIPYFLGGMGMGDLKLAAGAGAWIGPGQLLFAFVITAIAGGILAVGYSLWQGRLGQCLDNTGDLLSRLNRPRAASAGEIRLADGGKLSIPYAPAIAVGTLFSFFAY